MNNTAAIRRAQENTDFFIGRFFSRILCRRSDDRPLESVYRVVLCRWVVLGWVLGLAALHQVR